MSKKTLNFGGFLALSDTNNQPPPDIVLASGSPYRKKQLAQLRLPFRAVSADIDETALAGETAEALALRLSHAKANAVSQNLTQPTLVIGCDQTASCDGRQLTKPGNEANAIEQLTLCSGRTVCFHSGLCVWNTAIAESETLCVTTRVRFRPLTLQQIATYIKKEQPLDCAGSFKCEGLGICLFDSISSDDPSALVGLPLIALCNLLHKFHYSVL